MAAYIAYSGVLAAMTSRNPRKLAAVASTLHGVDFGWAIVVTAISGGVSSHLFPLFAFLLLAAAYRWGLRRTILESVVVVAVATAESFASIRGLTPWPFEFDWYVLWASYVVILAVLFGMLSDRMHVLSFQAVALGRLMSEVGQASGLAAAVRSTLRETMRLFGSTAGVLVAEEFETGRLYVWRADRLSGGTISVSVVEPSAADRALITATVPRSVSCFEAHRDPGTARVVFALDQRGEPTVSRIDLRGVADYPGDWSLVLGARFGSTQRFTGRLFLLDPKGTPAGHLRLEFLYVLICQVVPVLNDLYQLRGLRARAEARERARLARELHDGIVQSLSGLEMRVEAIRLRAEKVTPDVAGELQRTRDIRHEEAVKAREMMEDLRHSTVTARRLPAEVTELTERFSRETGIHAQLAWALDAVDLAPTECRDVIGIIREALVNVRRHSGASRVSVRAHADAGGWALVIEDNGRGMGVTGRFTHEELQGHGKGPRVIRERVVGLGGRLVITSSPQGTRLEMSFPSTGDE
jgi:signal transduction histidine kinase